MEISPYSAPGLKKPLDLFIEDQLEHIFDVTMIQIMVKSRKKHLVIPRMAYATAVYKYLKITEWGISSMIYDRFKINYDHATVHHARNTIEKVFIPGKVSNAVDKVFAKKVQEYFNIVEKEWLFQQRTKYENNGFPKIRTGERIRVAEIDMLLASKELS